MAEAENSGRPYRSTLRQRQAEQTRRGVIDAATTLFSRQGYQATTLAQIADRAGVSIETVQKHGPKSALLQAAVELASFGVEGETDFFDTDLGKAMQQIHDPDQVAHFAGEATLAINAPSAGLWMSVVGAAHGDEEFREYHGQMLASIRGQAFRVLSYINDRGWLRQDVPIDDLIEAFCVITSVETYARFVLMDGKSPDAYKAFVTRTVRETMLNR